MSWFNYYGLIIMALIMIPNIIFAVKTRGEFKNKFKNKAVEISEQLGRYACFVFMIFNIPYTYFGFWFERALTVYLCVNALLLLIYFVSWLVFRKNHKLLKAVLLSVTPTAIFLFGGIAVLSIPLIASSVVFGVCHITISCKNAL